MGKREGDGKRRKNWRAKAEQESEGGTGKRRRDWEGWHDGKDKLPLRRKKNYAEEEYHTGAVAG